MRRRHLSLDQLDGLPVAELKEEWERRFGAPAPQLSADLLRLGMGYRLQEQRKGGLERRTRSFLRQVAAHTAAAAAGSGPVAASAPVPRKLTPGTRLVRDWHGVGHTVVVLDEGFEYDGRQWKSLSAIARAITGSKWNGPLFFGLAGRKK